MCDWHVLFSSYRNSGVFHMDTDLDEAAVQATAVAGGLEFARVDLREVNDKSGLLEAIAGALEFPDYFGMNWDALDECLTDLSWRPVSGHVILLSGFRPSGEEGAVDAANLVRVLEGVAEYWKQREVPFYVILTGDSRPPDGGRDPAPPVL
jgi:RNAse (barnase) inhibitor barstar